MFGVIADAGIRFVEFLHDWIDEPAAELVTALDAAGLRCTSIKVPPVPWGAETANLDTRLGLIVDDAHVLGVDYVVAMMFAPPGGRWPKPTGDESLLASIERIGRSLDSDDWRRNADRLNGWGEMLRREGLRLAYHNTNFEFAHGEGCGMATLLRETDPALVGFELDVGYAYAGGGDPVALLRDHRGRFPLLHLKDVMVAAPNHECFQSPWTELGRGRGDWSAIFSAAEAGGVACYYIEQEPPFASAPLDSIQESIAFLDRLARGESVTVASSIEGMPYA